MRSRTSTGRRALTWTLVPQPRKQHSFSSMRLRRLRNGDKLCDGDCRLQSWPGSSTQPWLLTLLSIGRISAVSVSLGVTTDHLIREGRDAAWVLSIAMRPWTMKRFHECK
ncbi:hypothetical protein M752DRAFT_40888 [Aspergillus phoenicis ATCC 13157]|uniref:Uncharacterized protein n=1 Tax=Aspergillus phoenicis ATCC 13157 TaxID=1353007 RepID=A0A370PDJ1_ASPPH|nr:hypothetical protein M752DRAFT_40888 [Aspergillus phoenicis ATCC 13157]